MLQRRTWNLAAFWLALLFAPLALPQTPPPSPNPLPIPNLKAVAVPGIHNPSMIKAGNTWYIFSTTGHTEGPQLPIHCSTDLVTWTRCGYVFPQIPPWIKARLPGVKDLWAPDISYENGEYRVYYAYSVYARNTSGIALVTNKSLDPASPDYAWVDRGIVLESTPDGALNAIDPNFIRDARGRNWLVFGSYYDGINVRRLASDGLLDRKHKQIQTIADRKRPPAISRPPRGSRGIGRRSRHPLSSAIEAPFIIRHGNFYYLFTSWDPCCRGAKSTYHLVVGRSRSVTGPYRDEKGRKLMEGGGTTILTGNKAWVGPGGRSIWVSPGGQDLLVYHAYATDSGRSAMHLAPLDWSGKWPVFQGAL